MTERADNEKKSNGLISVPSKLGLTNSDPIIPSYYIKKIKSIYNGEEFESMVINVDYLTIIKDDIRNFRPLNKYQLSFIKYEIDDNIKNEIIDLYNESLKACIDSIMNS